MTALTWFAVVVLGIGSVAIFVFFLRDVRGVLPNANHGAGSDDNGRRRDLMNAED